MIHGSQRMNVDLPATVAAAAVLAAEPVIALAPVATAAPVRRAVSAAAPPRFERNAPGLAKPSALVMRLSSALDRCSPCPAKSAASPPASSRFSPMYFLRNERTSGTTIASRFITDELFIPLVDASALTRLPALSPSSAGTSVPDPAFNSDCNAGLPLPPPSRLPMLPMRPGSTVGLLIVARMLCAPAGVAPFCAIRPITAGSSPLIADCVVLSDSPRNCPASREKSAPKACWTSERRLTLMRSPVVDATARRRQR